MFFLLQLLEKCYNVWVATPIDGNGWLYYPSRIIMTYQWCIWTSTYVSDLWWPSIGSSGMFLHDFLPATASIMQNVWFVASVEWMVVLSKGGHHYILMMYMKQYICIRSMIIFHWKQWNVLSWFSPATTSKKQKYMVCHLNWQQWMIVISKESKLLHPNDVSEAIHMR
jgi:hypothetical protein